METQEVLEPHNVLEILQSNEFSDDKLFQFKGTAQELENIIRETLLNDPNLQCMAKDNRDEIEAWNEDIAEKEDIYKKQQIQLNELIKEKELLAIEYQARLNRIKGERTGVPITSSSQTHSESNSIADDDIMIIGTKPANTSASKDLKVGQELYVCKGYDVWKKGVLVELLAIQNESYMYKVRVDKKVMTLTKSKIAFPMQPQRNVKLGTRVIAAYTENNGVIDFYSGIVAEPPYEGNKFRYLIFFDDGCAQYSKTNDIRVVVEQHENQWEATHPDLQDFIKRYIETYGKRRILRLSVGQRVRVERDGDWHMAHCVKVDCSLVKMMFNLKNQFNTEWIYRGSTRFLPLYKDSLLNNDKKMRSQTVQGYRSRGRGMPTSSTNPGKIFKYSPPSTQNQLLRNVPFSSKPAYSAPKRDEHAGVRKPVPYPKNASRRFFAPHEFCSEKCVGIQDPSSHKATYLICIPIYFGFERYLIKVKRSKNSYQTSKKLVTFRAPCGRTLRNIQEVGKYLHMTKSKLSIDMFSFEQALHLFEPFKPSGVLMEISDISQGRENVALSCVNALSHAQPDKLIYSGVRMPQKDVKLTTDPNFMICCDCTDNCQDKSKCACQQLTYEGQQIIQPDTSLEKSGYQNRRLILDNENYSNITTGIYECNSQCKCKATCFNRVVQNPLSARLQIFKTELRGWGIRCLDDLPEGSFICIYAGQLHSDECADEDGREYGDEYFAELDFIEVAESLKEACYEEAAQEPGSSEEEKRSDSEWEDSESGGDSDFTTPVGFQVGDPSASSTKQLREKKSSAKPPTDRELTDKDENTEDKPAEEANESGELPEGYKSLRTYFGETNPYVMDAKTSGNLGRYLNHSCEPNVFVQTVFVDTHDPRFPWIAFFANSFIRAGIELTWDYGYRPGLVEGKVMYCHCKSKNCRGRLL